MAEAKKSPTRAKKEVAEPANLKKVVSEVEAASVPAETDAPTEIQHPDNVADKTPAESDVAPAKAGKRSAKAIKEAEAKEAKEERKAHADELAAETKPKPAAKVARPKAERAGKKYREALQLIDKSKEYSLKDALELATKTSTTKFDSTVELHVRLNVDPKQADQNVRGTIVLPSGSGKNVRVAVFGDADDATKGKKAGAEIAGSDDFLQQLDKGTVNFDILIATPAVMAKLGKYAKLLGPKGLMPNPKSGTVTTDVAKAVAEAKAGRVEYRVDSTGILHVGIGKVSFGGAKLLENAQALLTSVRSAKPASVKGTYVHSIFVSTTMGPSVRVSTTE